MSDWLHIFSMLETIIVRVVQYVIVIHFAIKFW